MAQTKVVHHYHHTGFGLGAILAVVLSWVTNHSVLWAIFHAVCGWVYVIYWLLFHYKG